MTSRIRKIFFISVTIISAIILTYPYMSFALETKTHEAINIYIAHNSFKDFSLNDYLKSQLGMQSGRDTVFTNDKLSQEVFKWLGDGGEEEDADFRPFNHFLNPLTDKGILVYYSALQWAMLPVGGQESSPFSSWNDAKQYFYTALTATDKATRETNFAYTSGYKERSL